MCYDSLRSEISFQYFKHMSANANDAVQYKGNKHNLNAVALDIAELVYNDWIYQRPAGWPNFQNSDKYAFTIFLSVC